MVINSRAALYECPDKLQLSGKHRTTQPTGVSRAISRAKPLLKLIKRHTNTQHPNLRRQTTSLLLDLPLEVREQIWADVLAPTSDSLEPHFHVYDVGYDSCLHKYIDRNGHVTRGKALQTALLRTCRMVYLEATQILYERTRFTLVIRAGSPRPLDYLWRKNNLGLTQNCRWLFERMRRVRIVVQPGEKPDERKYASRIWELLNALDYCRKLKSIELMFNFHKSMIELGQHNSRELLTAILRALRPIATLTKPTQGCEIAIQCCPITNAASLETFADGFDVLRAALGGCKVKVWDASTLGYESNHCLTRGRLGAPNLDDDMGRMATVYLWAACTIGLPVLVPTLMTWALWRKTVKAEW